MTASARSLHPVCLRPAGQILGRVFSVRQRDFDLQKPVPNFKFMNMNPSSDVQSALFHNILDVPIEEPRLEDSIDEPRCECKHLS